MDAQWKYSTNQVIPFHFAEGDFERPVYKKRKRTDEAAQLKDRVDRLVTLIQRVHCDDNEDFLRNDGEVTYLMGVTKTKTLENEDLRPKTRSSFS